MTRVPPKDGQTQKKYIMKTADIRERFLSYFEEHQHQRVASSPLVPGNDPTLLFTNAGMVQFKDVFLGDDPRDYKRATTSQRCVRAGGKHNDLENVGYTARHHTFFEMLGNFSFGDYFKRDAIQFGWNFLTQELGLPKERLWVTVFNEDQEAEDIWLNEIGIGEHQFSRIGAKDNFWAMGDTGPCGPCSEIFYDHGKNVEGGPPGTPEEDGDRFIEIWNLVFMQYDRSADGALTPLPKPSVDTGMGLERIAAVLQNVHNNYDIDLFQNITAHICQVLNTQNQAHHSVRVLADHIRSAAFLIVDGVLPSNEGRGYVLRRIIRRAIRHGYQISDAAQDEPFFYKIVESLVSEMGEAYPELTQQKLKIEQALQREEERFSETLDQGMKIFEQKMAQQNNKQVSGEVAFLLYDTYGFPVDLTADLARERGFTVDQEGFEARMDDQRQRARESSQFVSSGSLKVDINKATEFTGYQDTIDSSQIIALIKMVGEENTTVTKISAGDQVGIVTLKTPFYAEGGGQVGDKGQIKSKNAVVDINDTQKLKGDVFIHLGSVRLGDLAINDHVDLEVQSSARRATTCNHSATHLLHAALVEELGDHVQQKGSLVNSARFRFDFSHDAPITKEQINALEQRVNQEIMFNRAVSSQHLPIEEAKAAGAAALFGEKYGDVVRVVSMGDFSMELCGGTHVLRTGDIGLFKIVSESGVAAGVRRLEAVTGEGAHQFISEQQSNLSSLLEALKATPDNALAKVDQLHEQLKVIQKENLTLQKTLASGGSGENNLETQVQEVNGMKLFALDMQAVDKSILRDTIDGLKSKHDNAVILLASRANEKVVLIAGVSKSISKEFPAGKLIQHVTGLFGGRGGGRPDMAEGGIPNVSDVDECLKSAIQWLQC